jgi:hypothetical protein
MSYLLLAVQLLSGAVGGNALGAAAKSLSLGPVGNSIAGLIGGALGGHLLASLTGGASAEGTDGFGLGAFLASIAGGVGGGAAATALVAYLKLMFAKPT